MSKTLNRTNCKYCNSSNNLATWEYNGRLISRCMTPDCEYNTMNKQNSQNTIPMPSETSESFANGEYKECRGISKETCEKLGLLNSNDSLLFTYNNAQKIRYKDKTFSWVNYNKDRGLYGISNCTDYSKPIIITEGELDAASCVEAGFQAVSISSGASGARQDLSDNLTTLLQFSSILLWFDKDKPGQEAIKDAIEIEDFPLEKVKIINSNIFKDANEALVTGGVIAVQNEIESAKEYSPQGIIFGSNLEVGALYEKEVLGKKILYPKINEILRGIKEGRIYLIGAGTGVGKSTFTKEIAYDWFLKYPELKIANIYLEESQKYTLQSFIGLHVNKPNYLIAENPLKEDIDRGFELLNRPNLAFLDHFGSLKSNKFLGLLDYLATVKKFDVIILDHISIVISGMASKESERKDIDVLMTKLRELTEKSGVTIIAVSHLSRPQGDMGYEQGRSVSLNSFRGSGSLCQLSDVVIALERNQQGTDPNKTQIRILKNRITGKLGVADELYYNEDTGRLTTLDNIFG